MKFRKGNSSNVFRFRGSSVTISSGNTPAESDITWNDIETLRDQVNALNDGETLNLNGGHYISSMSQSGVDITHAGSITLPSNKSIHITNGNFYGGFRPSWTSDTSDQFGFGTYQCNHDFKTAVSGEASEIIETPPFLWSKYEKAPKLVSYPEVLSDVEFGSVGSTFSEAVDDYGFGSVDRISITQGSQVTSDRGYLITHDGTPYVNTYSVTTTSHVSNNSWSGTTQSPLLEGVDIGVVSISAVNSGTWTISITFASNEQAIAYEENEGFLVFETTKLSPSYTRTGSTLAFSSDAIGNLIDALGDGASWSLTLAYSIVGGCVFTEDVAAIKAAFNFNVTNGLVSDSDGCSLNVQSSDNRSYWVPIRSVTESNTPNELTFNFSTEYTSLTHSQVSTYFSASVFGRPSQLQAGQIFYAPGSGQIFWKPRDTRSINNSVLMSSNTPLFEISNNYVFPDTYQDQTAGSKVLSFSDCSMPCGYQFLQSLAARVGALVNIQRCLFSYSNLPISRVQGLVSECVFDQCFYAQLYGSSGLTVDKCWFGPTYQSSNINMSGVPDVSYPLPEGTTQGNGLPSIVRSSFFCNSATQHGQCVSFYQGTCNNAEFQGNIVLNTQRGIVMSPITPGSGTIRTDQQPHQLLMRGNLFVETDYKDDVTGPAVWNQLNFAGVWNHTEDRASTTTDEFPNFRFVVASNTHVSLKDESVPSRFTMFSSTQPIRIVSRFHNNYLQGASFPSSSLLYPTLTNDRTDLIRMKNNFWTSRSFVFANANSSADWEVAGIGSSGLTPTAAGNERANTVGCYLSGSTLLPLTDPSLDLLTSATDAGALGVRWSTSAPSFSDVIAIKNREAGYTSWWTVYSSIYSSLPDDESMYSSSGIPDSTWIEPGVRHASDVGRCDAI